MKTTLNRIREYEPCKDGWEKLLKYLGKTKADDDPISIATIIDSNGLSDALWCLRAVENRDKEIRLFAVWCARQVQHLMKDQISIDALDVAERYANGDATAKELKAAARAADAATWSASAASAAADAAWCAASATWYVARAAFCAASATYIVNADNEMRAKQEAELRRICEEGEG